MKVLFSILMPLFLVISCRGQEKEEVLHPFVLKAKETSLYADGIDWQNVNTRFLALIGENHKGDKMQEGLQYLINSLGDKHATIRSTKDHSIIVSYTGLTGKDTTAAETNSEFINTVINDITAKFSHRLLDHGVGYLKVVGIGAGDVTEQSELIRNGLVDLKAQGVDKWIVDLRFNGGGNIEPMISGLAPLIGEGFIGGAINAKNEIWEYTIKNAQFDNWGRIVCKMDSLPKINPTEKVAVLLSRYTISSGEMTAIAFKGRTNTKFIGEDTAGYTTGNGYDVINDDLAMVISRNVFIDRNKKKYKGSVTVDEYVEFQHQTTLKDDNQIELALTWLNE